jgi:hypothetical protein
VDRVFTRIGAQDDIAAGASTFMVEMMESAAILRHATEKSLVVLDEIGRGTSTYDGLAIARAIVEDLHNRLVARTVLATHFHELANVTASLPRTRAFNVAVDEAGDDIVFLRRLVPGAADRSYGVQVARLAGLADGITRRAAEILHELSEPPRPPESQGKVRERHAAYDPEASESLYPAALGLATRLFDLTARAGPGGTLTEELRRGAGHACAAILESTRAEASDRRARHARDAAACLGQLGVWLEIAGRCGELDSEATRELGRTCRELADGLATLNGEPALCVPS